MKLVITKSQNKGLMGGVSFEVRAQVQLAPPEQKLVDHYNLSSDVLVQRKLTIFGIETDQTVQVTVRALLNGDTYKAKNLGEVIGYTEALKSACEKLRIYLDVASGFGGQEAYEF
jgi:hypothetical protein